MKNESLSIASVEQQGRLTGWRKFVAVGALAPMAITACGDNAEAQPGPADSSEHIDTVDNTETVDTNETQDADGLDELEDTADTDGVEVIVGDDGVARVNEEYDLENLTYTYGPMHDDEKEEDLRELLGYPFEYCDDTSLADEYCLEDVPGYGMPHIRGAEAPVLEYVQNEYDWVVWKEVKNVRWSEVDGLIVVENGAVPGIAQSQ